MIGTAALSQTGQRWPLQNIVEVLLVDPPLVIDAPPPMPQSSSSPQADTDSNGKALRVKIKSDTTIPYQRKLIEKPIRRGWTEARVEFLEGEQEDEDALSLVPGAIQRKVATQFTSENNNNTTNNLIDQWVALARTKEQFDGQIDQLLKDLEALPSPPAAFWVGRLINPIPALGAAMEVRPQLLM